MQEENNNNNNNSSSSNLSSNHQEQVSKPNRPTTMTTVASTQNTATFESPPLLPLLEWPTPLNTMHVNTSDMSNDTDTVHSYRPTSLLFDTSDDIMHGSHMTDDIDIGQNDSDILDRFLLISPDVLTTTGSDSTQFPTPDLLSLSDVTATVTTATTRTVMTMNDDDEILEELQQNQNTHHLTRQENTQNYGHVTHAHAQPPSISFLAQLMSPSLFPMPQQTPMYEQFSITVEQPVSPVAPSNNQAVNYYPTAITPSALSASTSASGPSGVSILDVLNKIHGPTSQQQLANQSSTVSHNINEYEKNNIIKEEYQNNQNSSVNSSSFSQRIHSRSNSSSVGGSSTSLLVPQASPSPIFSSSSSTSSSSSSSSYSMTASTASTSTSSSSSIVSSSASSSASTSMSELINTFNQRMQAWPGLTFNQKPWILRTRKSSKGKNKGKRKSWSGTTSVSPTPSSNPLPPLPPLSPSASSSSSASSPLSAREVSFVDFYQAASASGTASSSSSAPSDVSHQVQRSSSLPSFSTLSPYSDHESSSDGTPPLLASSSNEQATRRSKRASTGQIIDYFQGAQEKRRKRQCVSVIEDNKGNQRKIYGYNWSQNTQSRKQE